MVNTDLTVLIPTYNRAKIVRRTIDLINKNLIYYGGETHILVGVDGDNETPELLRDVPNVKMLKGPRDGLGGNLNMLIDAAETTILFQMDDDHHLVRKLDVTEHAWHVMNEEEFGWIRLMYGWCTGHQGYYHFTAKLHGKYWRLLPNKTEVYLPSNRPHLKKKQFHTQFYGMYTPGLKLGQTEVDFCKHFAKFHEEGETPDVFIPMYPPTEDTWEHVGETWQHTEFDK
jgi:glycosyltransferase involved in cell wall biosynthesis